MGQHFDFHGFCRAISLILFVFFIDCVLVLAISLIFHIGRYPTFLYSLNYDN